MTWVAQKMIGLIVRHILSRGSMDRCFRIQFACRYRFIVLVIRNLELGPENGGGYKFFFSELIEIRRPLPELERARLQLQPSNTILQAAAPTILQTASYYAAGCMMHPTFYHLKGAALIRHSPPQAATGCHTMAQPRAPPAPPSPSNIPKSVLPPAQEC